MWLKRPRTNHAPLVGLQPPTNRRTASPLMWGVSARNRLTGSSSSELCRNWTGWPELRDPRARGHTSDEPDAQDEEEAEVLSRSWVEEDDTERVEQ